MSFIKNLQEGLSSSLYQKMIIDLYSISQSEHSKNGKLSMEVGSSRENDLKAVISLVMKNVDCKIDATAKEDLRICGRKISIKHISSSYRKTSFKLKWTSDQDMVEKEKHLLLSEDYEHLDYLLVYIDTKKNREITFVYIEGKTVKNALQKYKYKSFKESAKTNNRGIEPTLDVIRYLCDNSYFRVKIPNVTLAKTMDAVGRRKKYLKEKYSTDDV